jgi:arsenate reductase (glutaredoxin)
MSKKKKITIYHNARCSKSREVMDLLKENDCEIEVVEYMKETPTKKELKDLLMKLGLKPLDIIRTNEPLFEKKFRNKKFTDAEWIQIILENPVLLQRPILVDGYKAIIGRPVARVVDLLNRKK